MFSPTVFPVTVSAVHPGAINDEIILNMDGGQEVVASITQASTKRLGLAPGKKALALIKASFVILLEDAGDWLLSTRNQFTGTVKAVRPGGVSPEANGGMHTPATGSVSGLAQNSSFLEFFPFFILSLRLSRIAGISFFL